MPRKIPAQTALPGFAFKTRLAFGGSLLSGRRKGARPFDSRQALHVVLRSEAAKGKESLLRHASAINAVIDRQSEISGVRVLDRANAGNHLHLVLRAPSRRALRGYLRALSGLIVRRVLGAERGRAGAHRIASQARSGFWDARPFSRVVPFGRAYVALKRYVHQNRVEALGFSRPAARDVLALCRELGWDPPTS